MLPETAAVTQHGREEAATARKLDIWRQMR